MARRSKEQIRVENLIERFCNQALSGYQIDIMKLRHLSEAGENAAKAGKSDAEIEAAINAARDEHAIKAA